MALNLERGNVLYWKKVRGPAEKKGESPGRSKRRKTKNKTLAMTTFVAYGRKKRQKRVKEAKKVGHFREKNSDGQVLWEKGLTLPTGKRQSCRGAGSGGRTEL